MIVSGLKNCGYCGGELGPHVLLEAAVRCRSCGAVHPTPGRVPTHDENVFRVAEIAPEGLLAGKYRLVRPIRDEPMTKCLMAEHVYLSYPCIVKLVRPEVALREQEVRQLRGELERAFRVIDRHVARLLDCDVSGPTWYFVSEWVDGVPLDAVTLRRFVLPWQQVASIGIDAARALAAIHAESTVHGGLKPGNVILGSDGHARLRDVGVELGRDISREIKLGSAARGLGDAHVAPELSLPGSRRGAASDLYSLGAVLHELLVAPAQSGGRHLRRLLDQQFGRVRWPDEVCDRVPASLRALIERLLAPAAEQRPASASEVARELRKIAGTPEVPSAVFSIDSPDPRGVGVLPFRALRHEGQDDWVGYALASGVARRLAELPGTYVTEVDGLVSTLQRAGGGADSQPEQIVAAGRLAGAATVLTGRVHRLGDRLRVTLELLREGSQPSAIGTVAGTVARLAPLEQEITRQFARALGVRAASRTPAAAEPNAPMPAARERLVRGRQLYLSSDYQGAIAQALEAAVLDPNYGEALGFLGVCYARVGRFTDAEQHHRRHLALATQRRDDRQVMESLANLGVMHYFRSDFPEAEKYYRQAAELARDLGLSVDLAHISNNLGFVLLRCQRFVDAETAFRTAVETHRAYGALAALVGPYSGMGNVLTEQHRYDEARTYYRRALALAAQMGDRTSVGTTHMHLGRCAALEGRFEDAKREYAVAAAALEDTGFWSGLARAYEFMIDLHVALGATDEALRCAEMRLAIARKSHSVALEQAALRQKADLLVRAGRPDDARRCMAAQAVAGTAGAA